MSHFQEIKWRVRSKPDLFLFLPTCRYEQTSLLPLRSQLQANPSPPPGSVRGGELQTSRVPLETRPGQPALLKPSPVCARTAFQLFYYYFLLPCLQVCDKEWHHYVLNVEFPTVSLFVDGTAFEPFMVTEDYPLHLSKIETQLTVGACWQGRHSDSLQVI